MITRNQTSQVTTTTPQPSVEVEEEDPLLQLTCPHCQLRMPFAKMRAHLKAHTEIPLQCEFCARKLSTFKPSARCDETQNFNSHRGKCKTKWLASRKSQTTPLPAHSNQTLQDSTQFSPEEHHSGTSDVRRTPVDEIKVKYEPAIHASEPDQAVGRKIPLKTPPVSDTAKWKEADQAVSMAVEAALYSRFDSMDVDSLVNMYEDVVHEQLLKIFGTHEEKVTKPVRSNRDEPSRKEQKIRKEKDELNAENKRFKRGEIFLTEAELKKKARRFHMLLRKHSKMRLLRLLKKKIRETANQVRLFKSNPWQFGTEVFKPRNAGKPEFDKAEAEEYFCKTYSDENRGAKYTAPPGCTRPPKPKVPFNTSELEQSKLEAAVKKKRNRNAPGLNAIPFVVYKMCPQLLTILGRILNRVWKSRIIPASWQRAVVVLLAKSNVLNKPSEFRPIALLNAEGRLFFTLMNGRLSDYMLKNGYICTGVQKGFIERLAGCVEHSETVHAALLDARSRKKNLCVSWIDLANAYGSVRHSMILFTLEWYHIPDAFSEVIFMYYENLVASVCVKAEQTKWFRFCKGVFQGCTLSTMLFNTAFNTVFQKVKVLTESHGYTFSDTELTKLITGYADDIGILTNLDRYNQVVLDSIQEWLTWTQTMAAKPKKCVGTSLHHGVPADPKLTIAGVPMKWIEKEPFKFLGKQLCANASDEAARRLIMKETEDAVLKIDNLLLGCAQKMWIFDAVLMSMLSWQLLIHDMSVSFVEELGAIQTRMLKTWSHYSVHGVKEVFYRTKKNHGWGMKEMVPYFKKMQLVKCHLLKTSSDKDVVTLYEAREKREKELCSETNPNPVTRGQWQPTVELTKQLGAVKFEKMMKGARSSHNKSGLGFGAKPVERLSSAAEERKAVLQALEAQEEQRRVNEHIRLQHFSEWAKWDECMEKDRDWQRIIQEDNDALFKFEIAATEDQLPTPSVLSVWKVLNKGQARCHICNDKQCSLSHILSSCQTALQQHRYTWRHDSILLALYQHIRSFRNRGQAVLKKGLKRPDSQTKFTSDKGNHVKTGRVEEKVPLFEQSDDWELLFDLNFSADGQCKNAPFPAHITASSERPDGLMYSDKLKTVMWLELTSPWEENLNKAYIRKKGKYNKLDMQCRDAGWTVIPLYVEVGALGNVNTTWNWMSKAMGMRKKESKELRQKCSRIALRCSYHLYQSCKLKEWLTRPLVRY